jgi:hypothetical protein
VSLLRSALDDLAAADPRNLTDEELADDLGLRRAVVLI